MIGLGAGAACTDVLNSGGGPGSSPPTGGGGDGSQPGGSGNGNGSNPAGGGGSQPGSSGQAPAAADLPATPASCPTLASGSATIAGTAVVLNVGSKPGPLYLYWHATGTQANEVDRAIPGATAAIKDDGGVVASFQTSNGQGTNTGNGVWFTGDFDAADQIVACGIQQGVVDPSRIYTAGYSAGGLQVGTMVLQRRYLASAITYSGGLVTAGRGLGARSYTPPVVTAHGGAGTDVFILDFSQTSATFAQVLEAAGGFVIDCNDGGSHVALNRLGIGGNARAFLAAHPYGTDPSPYAAGLPSGWPAFCSLVL
jgi:hypothetical protein